MITDEYFHIIFLILFTIWFLIFIILSIKNINNCKNYLKNNEKKLLKTLSENIKLKSIPFWIINFIILLFFSIGALFGTRGFFIIFLPIPIIFTYLILLGTSIFSISYIRLLYKNNEIKKYQMIIHIILQLCFIWDIIDIIYLKIKIKNNSVVQTST